MKNDFEKQLNICVLVGHNLSGKGPLYSSLSNCVVQPIPPGGAMLPLTLMLPWLRLADHFTLRYYSVVIGPEWVYMSTGLMRFP